MDKKDTVKENLNLYARLRLSRNGPCLPQREGCLEIWVKGAKFRVRDATGRYLHEILGDLTVQRGLGLAPRTVEEIMDLTYRYLNKQEWGVAELSGDSGTHRGLIHEPGQAPRMVEVEKITPILGQIFTEGLETKLKPGKTLIRFGRACIEYQGFITGDEDGVAFKSEIKRIVSPPFLFLSEVRDAELRDYYYIREVIEFELGKVTDRDVEPLITG